MKKILILFAALFLAGCGFGKEEPVVKTTTVYIYQPQKVYRTSEAKKEAIEMLPTYGQPVYTGGLVSEVRKTETGGNKYYYVYQNRYYNVPGKRSGGGAIYNDYDGPMAAKLYVPNEGYLEALNLL